jgi:hypothetical protein
MITDNFLFSMKYLKKKTKWTTTIIWQETTMATGGIQPVLDRGLTDHKHQVISTRRIGQIHSRHLEGVSTPQNWYRTIEVGTMMGLAGMTWKAMIDGKESVRIAFRYKLISSILYTNT